MKTLTNLVILFSLLALPVELWAFENLPDNGNMPDVVHLRKDCASTNPDLKNCADNMLDMLNWVWDVRIPSASSPLIIDIGPGEFDSFVCAGASDTNRKGWVTVRGSGQRITTITGKPGGVFAPENNDLVGVEANFCTNLTFEDLTIAALDYGIAWTGGGTSTWSNVEVAAADDTRHQNIGWYENSCEGEKQGVHYWFGSRITAHQDGTNRANYLSCAETWFYGGEIAVIVSGDYFGSAVPVQLFNDGPHLGSMRMFGSALRVVVPNGNTAPLAKVTGVLLRPEGTQFHMHGGIISIDASGSTQSFNVSGIEVRNGSAHTPDTAFSVKAAGGGGNAKRVNLVGPAVTNFGANVQSPYLWPAGSTPPSAASAKSGDDQFVENDCSVGGNCNNGGNETHLMISNPAKCGTTDPWFDTQVDQCRAVNTP